MGAFLYYLPGLADSPTTGDLEAFGLGYAFADAKGLTRGGVHANGPDGGQGKLVCDSARLADGQPMGYYPDYQAWKQVPSSCVEGKPAWVGFDNRFQPGPADLERRERLDGYMIDMADGRSWCVPIARRIQEEGEGEPALPRTLELDADGDLVPGEVLPKYHGLWEIAIRYQEHFEKLCKGESSTFEKPDRAAAEVLGFNYVVGLAEIVMLGLLTHGGPEAANILSALIDLPGWFALKKKEAIAGSNIDSGQPAKQGVTDQH